MTDNQKLRGGYYTPKTIADFLASWAIRTSTDTVLEPSSGDGVLLEAAVERLIELGTLPGAIEAQVCGVELDAEEATKAIERIQRGKKGVNLINIHQGDFFEFCRAQLIDPSTSNIQERRTSERRFDAIIGNPPFIRYQSFPEEHRSAAFSLMEQAGFHPNRLTNAWLPFLIVSTMLLTEHGRLAMVIPAELFQVNYAAETRRFLSDYFSKLTILTFRQLVFPDIQQEVVLLLGEHNGNAQTEIQVYELDNLDELKNFLTISSVAQFKPMDHSTEKWTQYFLDSEEIELLRRLRQHPHFKTMHQVIDIDVGVVTGQNKFFILQNNEAVERSLIPFTRRIVTRSAHLDGAVFTEADWLNNSSIEYGSYLFTPEDVPMDELPNEVQEYILSGEALGFHTGFKCRTRKRWYIVPSLWIPEAFMLRQVHSYPKLILNKSGATCTDTIHRVRFLNGINPAIATAAFVNSLTFAFAEVSGRSYGGGVLTFEPTEAEHLPIPMMNADRLDLVQIDALLRENNINEVLDITDEVLLIQGLGLTLQEAAVLRNIWIKLRDRRINRKHKKAN